MLFFFSMLLVLGTFSGVFAAAANASQLNESGWKYLFWGMTPAQVGEAMQKHGSRYDGTPMGLSSFWYGFDEQQRPLVHQFDERDKNRLQWVRSGVGGTDLLFLDNRLFGVLVHDKASENAINDLLIKMIDYYPKAQLLPGDSPSNVIFQHQTAGRVIIWESDHQSFKLGFFDKNSLRVFTGFLPQPMESDVFKRRKELDDPGELLAGPAEEEARAKQAAQNNKPTAETEKPAPGTPEEAGAHQDKQPGQGTTAPEQGSGASGDDPQQSRRCSCVARISGRNRTQAG